MVLVDTPGLHRPAGKGRTRSTSSWSARRSRRCEEVDALVRAGGGPDGGAAQAYALTSASTRRRSGARRAEVEVNKPAVAGRQQGRPRARQEAAAAADRGLGQGASLAGGGADLGARPATACERSASEVAACCPRAQPLYPEEMVTDRAERLLGAEMIREQVFLLTKQEVPYAVAVSIDEWHERRQGRGHRRPPSTSRRKRRRRSWSARAGGWCARSARARARRSRELLDCPVHLKLFVRVDPRAGPRSRRRCRDLGYEGANDHSACAAAAGGDRRPAQRRQVDALQPPRAAATPRIVEDEPGVTRDRRYGDADWDGRLFRVVDTGGLDLEAAKAEDAMLARGIVRQAHARGRRGRRWCCSSSTRARAWCRGDREAAEALRKTGKPVLWVANKVDGEKDEAGAAELYALGADMVLRGLGHARPRHRRAVRCHPASSCPTRRASTITEPEDDDETRPIRLALVGRPNAGKSSLVNRFVGDERVLVDSVAGTTRDPVDTPIEIGGRRYTLIDTAGIRRRSKIDVPMEKIAVAHGRERHPPLRRVRAGGRRRRRAGRAGRQDRRHLRRGRRALVILFNKLDLIDEKQQQKLHENVKRQLQFVPWARVVFASAKTGKGAAAHPRRGASGLRGLHAARDHRRAQPLVRRASSRSTRRRCSTATPSSSISSSSRRRARRPSCCR